MPNFMTKEREKILRDYIWKQTLKFATLNGFNGLYPKPNVRYLVRGAAVKYTESAGFVRICVEEKAQDNLNAAFFACYSKDISTLGRANGTYRNNIPAQREQVDLLGIEQLENFQNHSLIL